MKYNRSEIMKKAWNLFRMNETVVSSFQRSFAECLKLAWKVAKETAKAAAEAAKKGITRMLYSEYKRNYAECMTVENSYDKATKTIEVMTKISRRTLKNSRNGVCPICRTWCYGDCAAR